jgi:hypothetical protein
MKKAGKFYTKYKIQKYSFSQKPKFHYKPTCEVGNMWEEHISHLRLAKGTVGV